MPKSGVRPEPIADTPPEWEILTGRFESTPAYGVLRAAGIPEFILLFTTDGGGAAATRDGWTRLGVGDALLLEPGCPHYYASREDQAPWSFYWAHFFPRAGWLDVAAWRLVGGGLRVLSVDPGSPEREATTSALARMHHVRYGHHPLRERLAMNALEEALLHLTGTQIESAPPDPRLRRVVDAVVSAPGKKHTVASMSRLAGLSASRFSHLFREQAGLTPQAFVERTRLDLAASMLRAGGRTVGEIAESLGFDSPFYFSRRFRRRFGVSPSRFPGASGAPRD